MLELSKTARIDYHSVCDVRCHFLFVKSTRPILELILQGTSPNSDVVANRGSLMFLESHLSIVEFLIDRIKCYIFIFFTVGYFLLLLLLL